MSEQEKKDLIYGLASMALIVLGAVFAVLVLRHVLP